jgi:hypothetical protein
MRVVIGLILVSLVGCVSQSTMLQNSQGQQVKCAGWGFGVIGVPVALATHADCMKKAHAAGYSEAPPSAKQ